VQRSATALGATLTPDDVAIRRAGEGCKLVASVAALLLVADAVTGIDDLAEASLQKFAADPQFALQLVVTGLPVRRSREEVAKQALRLDRKAIVFEN